MAKPVEMPASVVHHPSDLAKPVEAPCLRCSTRERRPPMGRGSEAGVPAEPHPAAPQPAEPQPAPGGLHPALRRRHALRLHHALGRQRTGRRLGPTRRVRHQPRRGLRGWRGRPRARARRNRDWQPASDSEGHTPGAHAFRAITVIRRPRFPCRLSAVACPPSALSVIRRRGRTRAQLYTRPRPRLDGLRPTEMPTRRALTPSAPSRSSDGEANALAWHALSLPSHS